MTNPTLEQRARALLIETCIEGTPANEQEMFRSGKAGFHTVAFDSAIAAMLTFSHTGVEQAIEAAYREGHMRGRVDGSCLEVDTDWLNSAARATLPAQSPDDIAYAGGAHQFEYGNCKDCPAFTVSCVAAMARRQLQPPR